MARPVILVTGLSGLIGSALRLQVDERTWELRGLNRQAVPGVPCVQADIADPEAIEPAFTGVDTVVHLAAAVGAPSFDSALKTIEQPLGLPGPRPREGCPRVGAAGPRGGLPVVLSPRRRGSSRSRPERCSSCRPSR